MAPSLSALPRRLAAALLPGPASRPELGGLGPAPALEPTADAPESALLLSWREARLGRRGWSAAALPSLPHPSELAAQTQLLSALWAEAPQTDDRAGQIGGLMADRLRLLRRAALVEPHRPELISALIAGASAFPALGDAQPALAQALGSLPGCLKGSVAEDGGPVQLAAARSALGELEVARAWLEAGGGGWPPPLEAQLEALRGALGALALPSGALSHWPSPATTTVQVSPRPALPAIPGEPPRDWSLRWWRAAGCAAARRRIQGQDSRIGLAGRELRWSLGEQCLLAARLPPLALSGARVDGPSLRLDLGPLRLRARQARLYIELSAPLDLELRLQLGPAERRGPAELHMPATRATLRWKPEPAWQESGGIWRPRGPGELSLELPG